MTSAGPADRSVLSAPVERALARDTLVTLAQEAQAAVSIIRRPDHLRGAVAPGTSAYQAAFDLHVRLSESSPQWAIRAQAAMYAGAIRRFCDLAGIPIDGSLSPLDLQSAALRSLATVEEGEVVPDRFLEIHARYRTARELRLSGDAAAALRTALRDSTYYFASGAEPLRGQIEFEAAAALLTAGQAAQVPSMMSESQAYWAAPRTKGFGSAFRVPFAESLAAWEAADPSAAVSLMTAALTRLRQTGDHGLAAELDRVCLQISLAELLTTSAAPTTRGGPSRAALDTVLALAERALATINSMPGRWDTIGATAGPIALTVQRLYGDLALIASNLPGRSADELGARVVLAAKQASHASRIRAERRHLTGTAEVLLEEVTNLESRPDPSTHALERLRADLADLVPGPLADMAFPEPPDLPRIRRALGTRHGIDFAHLPDSLTGETTWFRTYFPATGFPAGNAPAAGIRFDRLEPDAGSAEALLGADLMTALLRPGDPVGLVLAPDGELRRVLWAELRLDQDGPTLIERALILQTPLLPLLTSTDIPVATGQPVIYQGDSAAGFGRGLLAGGPQGWARLAADGGGSGLGQYVEAVQRLTAGRAAALPWTGSVLLASCRFGEVLPADGFVTGVLLGGARCVVAPTAVVPGEVADALAAAIERRLEAGSVSLAAALRDVQLRMSRTASASWAAFTAYVR